MEFDEETVMLSKEENDRRPFSDMMDQDAEPTLGPGSRLSNKTSKT